jgi:FG-GAP-like repeat
MFRISCLSVGSRLVASRLLKPFTSLIATVAGTALLSLPLSAAVTFTQTAVAAGGTNPASSAMVSGDFNNDGILDLVTTNPGNSTISFYKGLGGGQYAAAVNVSFTVVGRGPIFAADFNGDGKLDLAITYGSSCCGTYGAVTILLGNGDGTFRQGTNLTVTANGSPANASTIALADFNGDHKPDIAVSDGASGFSWIFLGKGDGTFTLSYTDSNGGGDTMVAGDFNADGKQDIAFAGRDDLFMLLGDGNGGVSNYIEAPLSGVTSLAVGDFYNDRIQTLVALSSVGISSNNGVYTYLYSARYYNGALYVENPNFVSGPNAEGPAYVTGGDLNGDFKFDVFISGGGYYSAPISEYMLGKGNGTFQALQSAPYDPRVSVLEFPFIRDLNLDSRHDVGMAWYNIVDGSGGADVLINSSAAKNCTPPPANKLSVNICTPTSGQTVPGTFTFKAAGNAFNGVAKRMELWIDGHKVAQNLEDQLKATVALTAGSHTATSVVIDSFDNTSSSSVSFKAN